MAEASSVVPAEGGGDDTAKIEATGESAEPEYKFEALVSLDKVELKDGEEDEDILFDVRCKLYRYDKDGNPAEWKERGVGQIKFLQVHFAVPFQKHKVTREVRILMRRDKTLKICLNHVVHPALVLNEHAGSDKAFNYVAPDFSEGVTKTELLAIRFGTPENAALFKEHFGKAQKLNDKLEGGASGGGSAVSSPASTPSKEGAKEDAPPREP